MSWSPIESLGSALIAAAIGAIGWIMSKFADRHIDTLDKVASKLGDLSNDVSEIQADIRAMKEGDRVMGKRVARLEDQYFQKGE